jgi:hypothetical protein
MIGDDGSKRLPAFRPRFAMQWPEFENMSACDIDGAGAEQIPASMIDRMRDEGDLR